ncbi:MAG: adenylate cyclase, partial [Bacteroidales bacterium]|nr:adenylate cyclase [Bacteroidales bacterium]
MHIETERKFLVKDTSYKEASTESHHLVQGYICTSGGRTVRVRLYDDTGYLTIKGPSQDGL